MEKSYSESYAAAGVDITAGYRSVELMKQYVARTMNEHCIGGLGGFGGLFELDCTGYKHPVLISGTDGVGTKLKIAMIMDKHDTIGIDCVAMCVNDVICAGAKSILDLGLTLEYLETKGVPVIGYGTDELPAFYTRKSGFGVDYRVDSPEELAAMFRAQRELNYKGGMLVTNPIPEQYAMDKEVIDKAIEQALAEAKEQHVHGKETTPFLLARVVELTGGDSLESNIKLVLNNATVAAKTAAELAK